MELSIYECVSINLYLPLGLSYNKQSTEKSISFSTQPHLQQIIFSIRVLGYNACQFLYTHI